MTDDVTGKSDEGRVLKISFRGLLLVYAIVPLSLLCALADHYLFQDRLREVLPRYPQDLRILNVFIILPHIVASASTFIDSEYLSFYKKRLLWGLPLIGFMAFGVPVLFGAAVSGIALSLFTVYHLMTQQMGITSLIMGGKPSLVFKLWKWLGILIATLLYFLLVASDKVRLPYPVIVLVVPTLALSILGGFVARKSRTGVGKAYVWANNGMLVAAIACYILKYDFFAFLIPRMVHDISGFMFYITHDANRNANTANRNAYYRLFLFTGVPVIVLSPALAVVVANALSSSFDQFNPILVSLGYFHYYTESFMWKRDAIHRKSVPLAAPPGWNTA